MNNYSNENLNQNLERCQEIETLAASLANVNCKIGRFGGRHYSYRGGEDRGYAVCNKIARTFVRIVSTPYTGQSDISHVRNVYNRICLLDEQGNEKLSQTTFFQWLATWIKRIGNLFWNRTQALERALAAYEAQEEAFIHEIVRSFSVAIRSESPSLSDEILSKIDGITSLEVYEKIREGIRSICGEEVLIALPLPAALSTSLSLSLLTRTDDPSTGKKEAFSPRDMYLMASAWKEHLTDQPEAEEKMHAFMEALKSPVSEDTFLERAMTTEQPLCYCSFNPKKPNASLLMLAFPNESEEGTVKVIIIDPLTFRSDEEGVREFICERPLLKDIIKGALNDFRKEEGEKKPLTSRRVVTRLARVLCGENYFEEKIALEGNLLSTYCENDVHWSEKKASLQWVKEVTIHLQQHNQIAKNLTVREVVEKCQKAIEEVELEAIGVKSSHDIAISGKNTSEEGVLDLNPPISPDLPLAESLENRISVRIVETIDFSDPMHALEQTTKWLDHVKKLREKQEFDAVDRAVMKYLEQFKDFNSVEAFIQAIPQEKIAAWSQAFREFSDLLVNATFALQRRSIPHTRLVALFRTFEITQKLLQNDESANFADQWCRMDFIAPWIKDPYLDLGSSGPEMMRILGRLTEKYPLGSSRVGFPMMIPRSENEYSRRTKVTSPPPSFFNTRHTLRLLSLVLIPDQVLSEDIQFADGSRIPGTEQREYEVQDREPIKKKLHTLTDPISFEEIGSVTHLILEPSGFYYMPPSLPTYNIDRLHKEFTSGSTTSFFYQYPPVKKREVRKRLIESIVTELPRDCRTEDGTDLHLANLFRYQGACPMQVQIQEENIEGPLFGDYSPSLCKKLQLMQTAPEYRVRETFHLFAENPFLLNDPDMRRLFSLNLFRSGYLYEKLKNDPTFPSDCIKHLGVLYKSAKNREIPLGFVANTFARVAKILEDVPVKESIADGIVAMRDSLTKKLEKELLQREAEWIHEEKPGITAEYQSDCREWLLAMGERPFKTFSLEERCSFAKRVLLFLSFPRKDYNEDTFAKICDAYDLMLPELVQDLKEDSALLKNVLEFRIRGVDGTNWHPEEDGLVWSNGVQVLNLESGALFFTDSPTTPLPVEAKRELSGFVSEEDLREHYPYTIHEVDGAVYRQIVLMGTFGKERRRIKLFATAGKPPIILMEMEDEKWFQLQKNPFSVKGELTLPRVLRKFQCWTDHTNQKILLRSQFASAIF